MIDKVSLEKLKGIPETLLIPLRGRYLETKRKNGIVNDPKSVEIIDSIEHSFSERDLPWDSQMMISARTEIFDAATVNFLKKNPDSVIVNLGSGLDTRSHRIDNGRMLWYDLDLPECIEIRGKFFAQSDRFKFIAKSVLDFSWVTDIAKDKKVLFIAEGLLNYFSKKDVKSIIFAIKDNFPDSELVFEVFSPLLKGTWHRHPIIKKARSMFKWTAHNGKSLEKWDSKINFLKEWNYFDRYPMRWRWMCLFRFVPLLRKTMKAVHLNFEPLLN